MLSLSWQSDQSLKVGLKCLKENIVYNDHSERKKVLENRGTSYKKHKGYIDQVLDKKGI